VTCMEIFQTFYASEEQGDYHKVCPEGMRRN
jgi:hypothetical protein